MGRRGDRSSETVSPFPGRKRRWDSRVSITGRDAMELCRSQRFDIVFADERAQNPMQEITAPEAASDSQLSIANY